MNLKYIFLISILLFIVSCGGGGGGTSYSGGSSGSGSSSQALANLNIGNACKKAWYTSTFPNPTTVGSTFNNYTFFWQDTSLEAMPICINKYEVTPITSTGGKAWDLYVKEIAEYSKYTLGQIVPINIFILGATPIENVTDAEKATYNTDFQTVQSRVGANYSNDLANGNIFPIDSAGGGYAFEAAPNGADMQLPQGLVWDKPGEYANDNEKIQGAFKIIAHEYFHTYQNSIKFYHEAYKTISIPKTWQSNPGIVNSPSGDPAYFPWWIEEGGADFGGIVMSAKFANAQAGIDVDTVINPVQQFKDHFTRAHQQFAASPDLKLSSFNLPPTTEGPDYAYQIGTAALLYAWYKDPRNFNAAMTKYYTDWQEAETLRPGKGFEDAFEDAFWKNNTEYYTLDEFDLEFRTWIRESADVENRWAVIAKTANQIIHANIEPTTPNTPTSATKTIQAVAAAKVIDNGGVNKYFIDGIQQKTLVVKAGSTYKFSHGTTHPVRFSTTPDGTHGGGVAYTTGVTPNSDTEVTIIAPNSSGTKTLYYYCANHQGMGGKIKIVEQFTSSSPSPGNSGYGEGESY